MADEQFLRAHEVMEYVYNVADVAYPISIRDQMNRARWLVQKAYDLGFFGPTREKRYRRLLVRSQRGDQGFKSPPRYS
jgi:hypothetical protein